MKKFWLVLISACVFVLSSCGDDNKTPVTLEDSDNEPAETADEDAEEVP